MINDPKVRFHDIEVSLLELRVRIQDKPVHFTLSEMRILLIFLQDPYRVVPCEELVQRADLTSASAAHTLINRLRLLLNQEYIFTGRGGYSFTQPGRLKLSEADWQESCSQERIS